jgi:seryl-tRNA synthetase
VNGSVLGWVRTLAAVLETYRAPDGSVEVPRVLVGYAGTDRITAPKAS